ncbi:MAG: Mur ligase family protein [Myxococcota bacterium]
MFTDPVASYHQLQAEIRSLANRNPFAAAINLRLERIKALLDVLGHPERGYPIVHVGGTSGKGSTATFTASLLRAHGKKVGLHLSPHLQVVNERHQIDLRPAPTSSLVRLWPTLAAAIPVAAARTPFGAASYFEVQLALSLLLFADEGVDVAVVEVGVGGTRDATNVLDTRVAILTNVGLDHTDILGDTVELIAADKIGIVKPNQDVFSAVTQDAVRQMLRDRCRQQGARLTLIEDDAPIDRYPDGTFAVTLPRRQLDGLRLDGQRLDGLRTAMPGRFQPTNAALALSAAAVLLGALDAAMVREALLVQLPGRIEQVQHQPTVILDGAHNPDKVAGTVDALRDRGLDGRRITVVAIKAGKDAETILTAIDEMSDAVILTRFDDKGPWKATPPSVLQAILPHGEIIDDPLEATRTALARASAADMVWVTGSLYLVGDVRALWHPLPALLRSLEPDGR